ncbi:MAG: hypothetical protein Q4P72_06895 [Eubacteriales bacterium]|nr:hypothetical protein [Eubacteriales bacterium]
MQACAQQENGGLSLPPNSISKRYSIALHISSVWAQICTVILGVFGLIVLTLAIAVQSLQRFIPESLSLGAFNIDPRIFKLLNELLSELNRNLQGLTSKVTGLIALIVIAILLVFLISLAFCIGCGLIRRDGRIRLWVFILASLKFIVSLLLLSLGSALYGFSIPYFVANLFVVVAFALSWRVRRRMISQANA